MSSNYRSIILNTVKISLATILAILVADALSLENIYSAGIVAILSIQPTKKETLKTAANRCIAYLVALVIAFGSFSLLGYNANGFYLYIFVFILVCQYFGWLSAMAMNSVIILHFIGFGNMLVGALLNETAIFSIGIIAGITANLHLHKDYRTIENLVASMDEQMQQILFRMSERLLVSDKSDYNGHCFETLSNCINTASQQAQQNYANQFRRHDIFDIEYIRMRRKQEFVLIEMYKNVRSLETTPETIYPVASFIKKVSKCYQKDNDVLQLLKELEELQAYMKNTPLPEERQEFENRAHLYILLRLLKEFLLIKAEFVKYHR